MIPLRIARALTHLLLMWHLYILSFLVSGVNFSCSPDNKQCPCLLQSAEDLPPLQLELSLSLSMIEFHPLSLTEKSHLLSLTEKSHALSLTEKSYMLSLTESCPRNLQAKNNEYASVMTTSLEVQFVPDEQKYMSKKKICAPTHTSAMLQPSQVNSAYYPIPGQLPIKEYRQPPHFQHTLYQEHGFIRNVAPSQFNFLISLANLQLKLYDRIKLIIYHIKRYEGQCLMLKHNFSNIYMFDRINLKILIDRYIEFGRLNLNLIWKPNVKDSIYAGGGNPDRKSVV